MILPGYARHGKAPFAGFGPQRGNREARRRRRVGKTHGLVLVGMFFRDVKRCGGHTLSSGRQIIEIIGELELTLHGPALK